MDLNSLVDSMLRLLTKEQKQLRKQIDKDICKEGQHYKCGWLHDNGKGICQCICHSMFNWRLSGYN